MKRGFIAHRREKDGDAQNLCSHLLNVSTLTGQFTSRVGLKDAGRLIGLLHDLGKASAEFDKYIKSATGLINPDEDNYVDAKEKRGKVDHSSAGAQIIYRNFSSQGKDGFCAVQALSLAIASHHSGLIDCLAPDGLDNFHRRMEKAEELTHTTEALNNLDDSERNKLNEFLSDDHIAKELLSKIKSIQETNDSQETRLFKIGLLERFLFSCLIDADRLDTSDFEFPDNVKIRNYGEYRSWKTLIRRLDNKIAGFEKKTGKNNVDNIRNDVSQRCLNYAVKPKGLYQLTVPTGGGKTLASLRFALNHAEHHKMDRIFYIIPFTSIIDQNAEELRRIFEKKDKTGKYTDDVILEHHSNLTSDEETKRQNLLSENWDAPVVFTTNVQFLEALFGSGTRSARRMHQLANSVIIFDEVQTIPVRCVQIFNMALRFLTHDCGSTVVLCTATQPLLDKIEPQTRALQITDEQQMMSDIKKLFKSLRRVEVHDCRKTGGFLDGEIAQKVQEELRTTGSVLTIVNTKASAKNLYKELHNQGQTNIFHLSTNMCPSHRLDILNSIKDRLKKNIPTICISTQLIEAGVDIDFGSVIRYVAGLDSIAQAAGRCNRHGIRQQQGRVLILNPKDESLDKLKDIRLGKEIAERVLDEYRENPKKFGRDVLSPTAMEQYYKYYFYARQDEMCYPVNSNSPVGRDDDLFSLLSTNALSVEEYKRVHNSYPPMTLRQSFQAASKAFHAIDSPSRGVIVPYGKEGESLVNQLCDAVMLEKQYKLLKSAQRYSVNLYPYEFEEMEKKTAVREVQKESGIYYMDYQYYSKDFGWSKEIVTEMKDLNF